MESVKYKGTVGIVCWHGLLFENNENYSNFIQQDVAARLYDEEAKSDFETTLRSVASTGFEQENLNALLSAKEEVEESRGWAIGEALAEAWLTKKYNVIWPWNLERDKRTPKASLPGADLIGFITYSNDSGDETRFLFGEVKTSSDKNTPPKVMNGKSGMIHQLEELAKNLSLIATALSWLHSRCKNTSHENQFKSAAKLFISSGNKAIALFGILVRDTPPSEQDLKVRAKTLSNSVNNPTCCQLNALYLPHPISDLSSLVSKRVQS